MVTQEFNPNANNGDHVRMPMAPVHIDLLRERAYQGMLTMSPHGFLLEVAKVIQRYGNMMGQEFHTGWSLWDDEYLTTGDYDKESDTCLPLHPNLTVISMLEYHDCDELEIEAFPSMGWCDFTTELCLKVLNNLLQSAQYVLHGDWDFHDHNGECYGGKEWHQVDESSKADYGLNGWWQWMSSGYGINTANACHEMHLLYLELVGFKADGGVLEWVDGRNGNQWKISFDGGFKPISQIDPRCDLATPLFRVNLELIAFDEATRDEARQQLLMVDINGTPRWHNFDLSAGQSSVDEDDCGYSCWNLPLHQIVAFFGVRPDDRTYLPYEGSARCVFALPWASLKEVVE